MKILAAVVALLAGDQLPEALADRDGQISGRQEGRRDHLSRPTDLIKRVAPETRRSPSISPPEVLRGLLILMVAALLSFAHPLTASAESTELDSDPFLGRWVRTENRALESDRLERLEHALSGLNWLTRKTAGSVLKRTTTPPDRIVFVRDGAHLKQIVSGRNGETSRVVRLQPATAASSTETSTDATFSWRRVEMKLILDWKRHQANGKNTYHVDPASGILHVTRELQVTAIEGIDPIRFRSQYRRADTAAENEVGESSDTSQD